MTTSPLAYFWGDDDFMIARRIDAILAALSAETEDPPERWDPWSEPRTPAQHAAAIAERLTTATMFGGGTFVVLRNPGPLVKKGEDRDMIVGAIEHLASGNGIAVIDAHGSGTPTFKRKDPPHKRLADAVAKAGGLVRMVEPPTEGAFVNFIQREATSRGLSFGPDAAAELAARVGGSAAGGDIERRYQTRMASTEIDKLALYRPSGTITVDDVRALVPDEIPGSMFVLTDAISARNAGLALDALDKVAATTPEPVLLVLMHRRIRELIEVKDRLASGETRSQIIAATGLKPYPAEKAETDGRNWSIGELTAALDGLLELDAMVKHAPGSNADDAQRRLAFTLWVMDHVPRRERRSA